jgi:hypothetical protein
MQGGAKLGREVVPLPLGMTSRYLRVVPSKLEFKEVEAGVPLVAAISVLNISALAAIYNYTHTHTHTHTHKHTHRCRISQPCRGA